MKKKYTQTLVALVVLATLWAAFTFYDKRKAQAPPTGSTTETKTEEKLLPLDSQHIQSFALKPKDAAPVTCRLESGKWAIEEPQKLAADQSTISSMLNSLTTATVDQVVDPHPANLKDFGLDPPHEILEVSTDAKPAQFDLMLGDDTPTGNGMYAQVAGNLRLRFLARLDQLHSFHLKFLRVRF